VVGSQSQVSGSEKGREWPRPSDEKGEEKREVGDAKQNSTGGNGID
jgi:hypothetical protein